MTKAERKRTFKKLLRYIVAEAMTFLTAVYKCYGALDDSLHCNEYNI